MGKVSSSDFVFHEIVSRTREGVRERGGIILRKAAKSAKLAGLTLYARRGAENVEVEKAYGLKV